jgi:type IV secretion system protein TrbI
MSEAPQERPSPPKVDPETLVLRAAPRRVIRFKRRILMGIAALVCISVFGATWLALEGPVLRLSEPTQELYNIDRKPAPDALAALPLNYAQVRNDTPQLGPPLPGDLGRPILERQRELGIAPGASLQDQAAVAEREHLAQQAQKAREAGVFFQIAGGPAAASSSSAGQGEDIATTGGLLPSADDNRLNLDLDRDQNNQQRKLDFLTQPVETSVYNPHPLQTPALPHQVMAGSIIAASLITGLSSDLPGLALAQVTENVYDSVTGRMLLIPQGARLIGAYDSVVAFG